MVFFNLKQSTDNVKYLGTVNSAIDCEQKCFDSETCTSFTWYDMAFGKGWSGQCYGRTDGVWNPTPEQLVDSGQHMGGGSCAAQCSAKQRAGGGGELTECPITAIWLPGTGLDPYYGSSKAINNNFFSIDEDCWNKAGSPTATSSDTKSIMVNVVRRDGEQFTNIPIWITKWTKSQVDKKSSTVAGF